MNDYKNIKEFCEKLKAIRDRWACNDITEDEEHFIYYWEAYLAVAIIADIDNKDCVKDIANIMLAMAV